MIRARDLLNLSPSPDLVLFKFRNINKNLIDSLVNSYLYFAPPSKLNDPFDCQVDLDVSLDNAILKCENEKEVPFLMHLKKGDKIKKVRGDIGICSFSRSDGVLENSLMWSHYADSHKGVCFSYKIPEKWFIEKSFFVPLALEVKYGKNLLSSWLIKNAKNQLDRQAFNNDECRLTLKECLLVKSLTVKDECWSYEKEFRAISRAVGPQKIDRSFLTQICFGLNTSESDIKLIRNICLKFGYAATFLQVKRNADDFGLITVEML